MVRVSVVIPTFDRKEFLQQAVETVQVQTCDVECVVIDDGSTDGTKEYLENLDYGNLHTVYHEENHGQSVARNAGIDVSSGEYILFLDSDDILYPHAAETLVETLEEHPADCAGAFASKKLINTRGRSWVKKVPKGLVTDATVENARSIGSLSCTMFRRDALIDTNGFDESLSRHVDFDLYLKMLGEYGLFGVDEICCERRIHDGQITKDEKKVNKSYQKVVEKHSLGDI